MKWKKQNERKRGGANTQRLSNFTGQQNYLSLCIHASVSAFSEIKKY